MNLYDVILYFTFYSFLGWVMETIFASIKEGRLINRGFLTGFFCPIYGFGAVLILISSGWIETIIENSLGILILSLLTGVILVTLLEYITGFLLEKFFNCKWWDYSHEKFNLRGYICLSYSLLWGGLALLLLKVIHPSVSKMISSFVPSVKGYLIVLIVIYFLSDTFKSVIDSLDLRSVILNTNVSDHHYFEKIIQYKRFFNAFPRLLILNANIRNREIKSILSHRMDKIKGKLRGRFN